MGTILSCKNVTARYDARPVVSNVSFDMEAGDYLCIVGENGSGKSTLLKCILGLVKPAQGEISFSGISRSRIGYVPQQAAIQKDFPASVREVVFSGFLNQKGKLPFYTKKDKAEAANYLRQLGMESLAKKSYRNLSGGQQQRVLLARALCATGKLLLLDEPVTGLDPAGMAELYALLQRLNQTEGVAIAMVTHDVQNAVKYGNKILHMQTSQLFFGSTGEYECSQVGQRMLRRDGHV